MFRFFPIVATLFICLNALVLADDALQVMPVEGQPLAANVDRLIQAVELLGARFPASKVAALSAATHAQDPGSIQRLLDPEILFEVSINPESRVKVRRGPAAATLQQAGYSPVLIKIVNASTVTKRLRIVSPQSGPVYGNDRITMA